MRKIEAFAAAAAAAALVVMAPLTASAATSSASTHQDALRLSTSAPALSFCGTGRVASTAVNLPIRSAPFLDAPLIETVNVGAQFNCSGFYYLSDRYTACGTTNANGWLELNIGSGFGYTYLTCLKDV
jgi:hypothetical protein